MERCAETINHGGWPSPCSRNGRVFDQNKWWCTQHSPAKKAERVQKQDERYKTQTLMWEERQTKLRYDHAAGDYCRASGLSLENLSAPVLNNL